MDKAKKVKELREMTGMNRKQFCDYFEIPYRTVSEWERDGRHAPDYVIRLLEYYIRVEKVTKESLKKKEKK
ncbi:MAG: helix-turn-helix domain-containing protein [Lachnospiraceae bacterium]|nr:helix-turn-helix domain-containing protein [Lachnospiraceae bacterium]